VSGRGWTKRVGERREVQGGKGANSQTGRKGRLGMVQISCHFERKGGKKSVHEGMKQPVEKTKKRNFKKTLMRGGRGR